MSEWLNPRHHKALSSDEAKVQTVTWLNLLRQLARSPLHHGTFHILEAVFFHPIFPNRPLELCSQLSGGLLLQDVRDLTVVDVIKGCALVIGAQRDDNWSNEPVALVIKDGHYLELDLLSLTRLPKLFPGGSSAVVFSKVLGQEMKPGVYVHEVRRGVDVEKDEVRCEGLDAFCNEEHLKSYSWGLLKALESQIQAKLIHFQAIYKLTKTEKPYVAYVLKCLTQTVGVRKQRKAYICPRYNPQPLTAFMTTTNPWKAHKTMKLHTSLRSFVVNPQEEVIIHPSSLPSVSTLVILPSKAEQVQQKKAKKTKKTKEVRGVLHKRTILPLLKRDWEIEPKTMELQGKPCPWRHPRLDLSLT